MVPLQYILSLLLLHFLFMTEMGLIGETNNEPSDGCFYPKSHTVPWVHILSAQVDRVQTEPLFGEMWEWYYALFFGFSCRILDFRFAVKYLYLSLPNYLIIFVPPFSHEDVSSTKQMKFSNLIFFLKSFWYCLWILLPPDRWQSWGLRTDGWYG